MDIDSTVYILTTFLLILLAVYLFTSRKGNRLSNRILSTFFFFNVIYILLYVIIHLGYWFEYPPLYLATNSLFYFMGPLLYIYTKSVCYKDFRLGKKTYIHSLPFLGLVVLAFSYYLLKLAFFPDSVAMRGDSNTHYKILTRYEVLVYFCILYGFLMFFSARCLKTLSEYRRDLRNQFSNIEPIKLSWLTLVILAYLIIWMMDLIVYLLLFIRGFPKVIISLLNHSSGVINFVFALYIVYKGLKQSDIFTGITREKYKTARLPQHEIGNYKNKIEAAMADQKPHLNPELNLENLAEIISISPRRLSQVINVAYNQNFYDFVSNHRIAEAKRILSDPANKEKTILEILYDVGFNSKSSFNHLFKKKTGKTPSEYRKNNLSNF